jgi:hypothetical protein
LRPSAQPRRFRNRRSNCVISAGSIFDTSQLGGKLGDGRNFDKYFVVQVAALSLIQAAYFDPSIDIPHTIIVSHFAVMMSACRSTSNSFSIRFLRSRKGIKTVSTVWILDLVFRPILLAFNLVIWSQIRRLQRQDVFCSQGSGQWVFFVTVPEIAVPSATSRAALAFVLLDTIWEALRFIAEIARLGIWFWQKESRLKMARQIGFDPRIWWVKSGLSILLKRNLDWDWEVVFVWVPRFTWCYKILTCFYVVWSVERMIWVNGLSGVEAGWTFGQKFALVNMLALSAVVCNHYRVLHTDFETASCSPFDSNSEFVVPLGHAVLVLPPLLVGVFGALYLWLKYFDGVFDFFAARFSKLDSTIVGWLLFILYLFVIGIPFMFVFFFSMLIVVVIFGGGGSVVLVNGSLFLLSRGIAVVLQFVRSLYNATEQDETDEIFEMESLRRPMNPVENADESIRTA